MTEIIKHQPLPRFSVGIDAGAVCGVGVWDRTEKRLNRVFSGDFFDVVLSLSDWDKPNCVVYLEIPPPFMYERNNKQKGAVRDKHLINIGQNIGVAKLLFDALSREGFRVVEVPPVRETKWTAEQFKAKFKTDIKTNQHVRDAARIALFYSDKRSVE